MGSNVGSSLLIRRGATALLVAWLSMPIDAQVTRRVSVGSGGAQGNFVTGMASVSADGRYVAFESFASNLVVGDSNGWCDVFVHDRRRGTTELVSVDSSGVQGNGFSGKPAVSSDGRHVAFYSRATNLVGGDTNGYVDIFVRDRVSRTTERVSIGSSGQQGNSLAYEFDSPGISADGRFVAFVSQASNLVAGDSNGFADVFVRDRLAGTTERVSVDSAGTEAIGISVGGSISADGSLVAFESSAPNLVAGDTNGFVDVFVRDRIAATTERVSVDSTGAEGNGDSLRPSISGDGRAVAFDCYASNLVPGDSNSSGDVVVRDRLAGTTELASVDSTGAQATQASGNASISGDGRHVAFDSLASNLVGGDTNGAGDVFLRDRLAGTTERVSVDSAGGQGNLDSSFASVTPDGRYLTFSSAASNLVAGDTNGYYDAFVHDRQASGFTTSCDPGSFGVIGCPCSNPPGGSERGCDNSAGTGGAILSASGVAYLSMDSLVFTTSGELTTALSILGQWTGANPTGTVFGMGVRCTSGHVERLYTKSAVAGGIVAPDPGAGELPVSVRSAALGDPILAGQSRWYLVHYRDPIALGGCPSTSTFNATRTGRVTWWP